MEVPRTPPAHAPVMSVQGTTSVRPPLEQLLPTLRSAEDEVQGSPPVFFRYSTVEGVSAFTIPPQSPHPPCFSHYSYF